MNYQKMIEKFNRTADGIFIKYDPERDEGEIFVKETFDKHFIPAGIRFSSYELGIGYKEVGDCWFHVMELQQIIDIINQIRRERDVKEINSITSDLKT